MRFTHDFPNLSLLRGSGGAGASLVTAQDLRELNGASGRGHKSIRERFCPEAQDRLPMAVVMASSRWS